jgi:glycosyltransferase involved in cell wall biosynthesis
VRVAVLAPISWRVPPRHYGPWELFASLLSEGLVARGHDVTLFAVGDSRTAARLCSVIPQGWSEDSSVDPKVAECLHISEVFERASEFDVIHNSFDFLPLTYSGLISTPVITTIHGFSSPAIVPVYAKYNESTFFVAISDADRHPALDYLATIHHGIDMSAFTVNTSPGSYLAFFGRIHPDKGVVAAIEAAKLAGMPLRVAGIIQDETYFEKEIVPLLDREHVQFLGSVPAEHRSSFLGGAAALLHLVDFDEPFGLSVVEAMACGTPVIASNRGSMPELIIEGVTGSIVADVESAARAARALGQFDRVAVRASTVQRFSVDRMVDEYVAAYSCAITEFHRKSSNVPVIVWPARSDPLQEHIQEETERTYQMSDTEVPTCAKCGGRRVDEYTHYGCPDGSAGHTHRHWVCVTCDFEFVTSSDTQESPMPSTALVADAVAGSSASADS